MKRLAIAIVVVVGAVVGLASCRRAMTTRTEAAMVRDAIDIDGVHGDLYLPAPGRHAPWLAVLGDAHAHSVAEPMQRRGVAVLSLSCPEGPADLRAMGECLTRALRAIARRYKEYGLKDAPVLAGLGAWAAPVVELALGARSGASLGQLAGVVAINGDYAAPLPGVRADAPPTLLLSAHGESPVRARRARSFARALERAGADDVHAYYISAREEPALLDFSGDRNDVADLVASFARREPAPGGPENAWIIADTWGTRALLSTEPFFQSNTKLVVRQPVDEHLRAHLSRVFADTMRDLDPWPLETYDAIDLDAYLGAHAELGKGDWLVTTNARGETLVLSRDEIRKERPLIVVGLDDERNLFRLLVTYNVYRTYTFRPETGPRPLLARPVGAFLHFPKGSDTEPRVVTFADFALTIASFRLVESDPRAVLHSLPQPLAHVLGGEQGCLQCHSLRASGARSHHLRAIDGQATGGDALAFEEYPVEVLRRFLFQQDEVAQIFGVAPIRVDPRSASQLLAEVTRTRYADAP